MLTVELAVALALVNRSSLSALDSHSKIGALTDEQSKFVIKLRHPLHILSRFVFRRATCLDKSLAVMTLLQRRGIPASIQFGIASFSLGKLVAHAWINAGGIIIVEPALPAAATFRSVAITEIDIPRTGSES